MNSIITRPRKRAQLAVGETIEVRGLAWDAGYGIARVDVSLDDGRAWQPATLGEDLGRYSFRPWSLDASLGAGSHAIRARAVNRLGQTQVEAALFNPPGYQHNVVPRIEVTVS